MLRARFGPTAAFGPGITKQVQPNRAAALHPAGTLILAVSAGSAQPLRGTDSARGLNQSFVDSFPVGYRRRFAGSAGSPVTVSRGGGYATIGGLKGRDSRGMMTVSRNRDE